MLGNVASTIETHLAAETWAVGFGFEADLLRFERASISSSARQRAEYMARNRRLYQQKLSLLHRLMGLRPGCRLLSVATGFGIDVCEWARTGVHALALEISSAHCRDICGFAELYGAEVGVCQANAESLPFAEGAFDAVFTENAFEHFADPLAALREQYRVLRPGGRIAIIDGNILQFARVFIQLTDEPRKTGGRAGGLKWLLRRHCVRDVYGSGYLCRDEDWHTPRWWQQRLRSERFVNVDCRTTSEYYHPERQPILHPFCGQCLIVGEKPYRG